MTRNIKILNIYGQRAEHCDARITGNMQGLLALKVLVDDALSYIKASKEVFASDGEGYEIIVERHDDVWGLDPDTGKPDPNSYWHTEEGRPVYTIYL